MGVPRARRTKSKQGSRRSHLALKKRGLTACAKCSVKILPHMVCYNCGSYKGRQIVEMKVKKSKIKSQK